MFRIFKEFLSDSHIYKDDIWALLLNVIGGSLIGLTFLIIGIICVAMSHSGARSRIRQRLTVMFGLFLISCAFSRFLGVLCIWYNYAILDGWIKILTGLLALFSIVYIPKVIKEIAHEGELAVMNKMLKETKQGLEEIKKLSTV